MNSHQTKQTKQNMKTHKLIALAGLVLCLPGCIPSVNPFYTDKDVAFDSRLVGTWQEKGKDQSPQLWRFEKAGDKAYKLAITEEHGKQGEFSAHLFKLKQDCFLDLIPNNCDYATNQADLVAASMFPGHLLVRVSQIEPELKLAFFNFEWLQQQLTNNPNVLAHHREDDRFVLTAGTAELQGFVLKHLGEGELFDQPGEFVRQTKAAER
jgi:hypothetical protein